RLRVSRVKLFIPSRGSRNSKRSLGKAFVRISARSVDSLFLRSRVQPLHFPLALE
ncbi:hypothetical protein Tco_0112817, partial [Tanacetum coccineum]